jgi:hypothetical protein
MHFRRYPGRVCQHRVLRVKYVVLAFGGNVLECENGMC